MLARMSTPVRSQPATSATAADVRTAIAAIVAAALVLVGSLGTWATISVSITPGAPTAAGVSKGGLDGDGGITLVLAFVAAAMAVLWATRPARWQDAVAALAAGLTVVIGIVDVLDVRDAGGGAVEASVGWGLWLVLLGGIALAITAVLRFVRNRTA